MVTRTTLRSKEGGVKLSCAVCKNGDTASKTLEGKNEVTLKCFKEMEYSEVTVFERNDSRNYSWRIHRRNQLDYADKL
ncbi:Hypothetical protein SMAX5B_016135 [Scophthalmus maximus]|uniref:Uncharacterized protein n=1 Tax=Scophthalmus maximus TaxID=52904 RepID=A0A2U9BBG3_SCOMX|nr:Hypothetical protein SMAX5B_016135 [Scophthalmus maximus]